jgi:DNA-binding NarL/FixJ family response regulator
VYPPEALGRIAGRDTALEAIDAACAGPRGWIVLEGGPGTGVSTLLAYAQSRGAVCVEDAERLDVDALAALPSDAPVVLAVRCGMPVADPAALAAARARAKVVRLEPLDAAAVARVLGVDADRAAKVVAETGGHPRTIARHGRAIAAGQPVDADEIGGYWADRIALVGPDGERLAESVHVLGDRAPLWLAAALAGIPREDAARAADALVDAGLLRFADPLTHAIPVAWRTLAEVTDGARRHESHRRAARLLADTADGLAAAAAHLLAVPPAGEAWAAEILRDAAQAAIDGGRHDDAVRALERALAEPVPRDMRIDLLVALAAARDQAGGDAEDAYRQALRLAPPERRPRIHLALGRALYGAGRYRDAALELDQGLGIAAEDDPVTTELLAAYVAAARFDRTLEDAAAQHLMPLLERTGAGRTAAERALLAELALERGIRGYPRTTVVALALRAWADGLFLQGADPYGISLSQLAAALTWSDAFDDSIRVLTETIAWAERSGTAQLAATARYLRAWPQWYKGELDAAERDVRSALGAPGWEMYEPAARAILGHILFDRGQADAAAEALALDDPEAWRRTVPYAMLLETRSRLHVRAGDLQAAAADLAEVGSLLDTMGNLSPFCPWRSRLAYVTARLGDPDAALGLVRDELEQAERIGTPRATGFALYSRGRVRHLAGDDGLEDLAAAVETLAGCGARLEQARALTAYGAVLAARGRREDARRPLREALELATALGAADVAERARRELHAAGGRPPRDDRRVPGGLTASELVIARLVAQGLTNREVAEQLVVSPHTVRFHLSGVYRKLGVSEREAIGPALRALDSR